MKYLYQQNGLPANRRAIIAWNEANQRAIRAYEAHRYYVEYRQPREMPLLAPPKPAVPVEGVPDTQCIEEGCDKPLLSRRSQRCPECQLTHRAETKRAWAKTAAKARRAAAVTMRICAHPPCGEQVRPPRRWCEDHQAERRQSTRKPWTGPTPARKCAYEPCTTMVTGVRRWCEEHQVERERQKRRAQAKRTKVGL